MKERKQSFIVLHRNYYAALFVIGTATNLFCMGSSILRSQDSPGIIAWCLFVIALNIGMAYPFFKKFRQFNREILEEEIKDVMNS